MTSRKNFQEWPVLTLPSGWKLIWSEWCESCKNVETACRGRNEADLPPPGASRRAVSSAANVGIPSQQILPLFYADAEGEWGWPPATRSFATSCFFSRSRRHSSPDRRCKSLGEDWAALAPGSWKPVIIRDLVMRVAWGRVACRSASPTISASCSCGPESRWYHHLRPDLLQCGHVILRFLAKVKHLFSRFKFK